MKFADLKLAPPVRKPRPKRVRLPSRRFTCAIPSRSWVLETGLTGPELTRAYVAEFERLNHFIPTTEG